MKLRKKSDSLFSNSKKYFPTNPDLTATNDNPIGFWYKNIQYYGVRMQLVMQ